MGAEGVGDDSEDGDGDAAVVVLLEVDALIPSLAMKWSGLVKGEHTNEKKEAERKNTQIRRECEASKTNVSMQKIHIEELSNKEDVNV